MAAALRKSRRARAPEQAPLGTELARLLGLTILFVLVILLTACASGMLPLTIG